MLFYAFIYLCISLISKLHINMRISKIYIETFDFIKQLYLNKDTIYDLTRRDFTSKYIKNYFGLTWAVLDPLAFIVVLYFVFGMRFGDRETLGVPFIIYLLTGYTAFDFISKILNQACDNIRSYSYMITKVNFRLAILPIVKLLSGLMMLIIILLIVFVVLIFNSFYPNIYWIQIIYYIIAMFSMLLGLAWIVSSVSLFFPDLQNIVSIIVRLLFFLTPIFWHIGGLPEKIAFIVKFNPFYYIITGFRESLLFKIAFWDHPLLTIYYWSLTLIFILSGIIIFKKLRPHFADVI